MKVYKHICNICKKEIEYSNYKSYYSAKSRNGMCKSCRTSIANKSSKRNMKMENNPAWKGHKNIPYKWFSKYFERANKKRKGNITIEQMYNLWIFQDQKCALSGVEIGFNDSGKNGSTCSIDRIDSSKEYTIDNVQLVHKDINIMKNKFENDYFIEMCKLIGKKN